MHYGNSAKFQSFCEVDSRSFSKQLTDHIKQEVESKDKEYILGADEEEFLNSLIDKFTIEPLIIDFDNEVVGPPEVKKVLTNTWDNLGRRSETDAYTFIVSYPFSGSSVMFKVRPDTFTMTFEEITINEHNKTVSFSFTIYKQDPYEFKKAKDEYHQRAFANYPNVNSIAEDWNSKLKGLVSSLFLNQKSKFLSENNFFAAINVKVNKDTASVFTAPTIKKKIIPQPSVSKTKEFSSEPIMSKETYDDILKVIYESGKNMEKKLSLYKGKDEESLRDQFIFVLETRYEGTSATGETFNRRGKTDILLKYANDGSNLFVGECKFWHGSFEFLNAISQLFDRYLTWRDSKTALIIFVTNKDFTNVIQKVKTDIKSHPYYTRDAGKRGETSFSYIFHLPQDENKEVFFEVMLFHYDK